MELKYYYCSTEDGNFNQTISEAVENVVDNFLYEMGKASMCNGDTVTVFRCEPKDPPPLSSFFPDLENDISCSVYDRLGEVCHENFEDDIDWKDFQKQVEAFADQYMEKRGGFTFWVGENVTELTIKFNSPVDYEVVPNV
jgi:hypothetical protein